MYETMASVSRNVTPLEFASMSPTVVNNSKILLLSTSGKNMDIKFAAKKALKYNKSNALASIQLLIDALAFIFDFAENHHGVNPNDPVNYSGIDKRGPINGVSYVTELENVGEMSI